MSDDLRDRVAEALRKAAYSCPGDTCPHDEETCGEGEPITMDAAAIVHGKPEWTLISGEVTAIADAVVAAFPADHPCFAAWRAALAGDGHTVRETLRHHNPGELKAIEDAAVLLSLTASQMRRGDQPEEVR